MSVLNNGVNTSLSGQTGTGTFVGATSPTLITPTVGVATANSLTFSPSTNGIVGTTTNNNASAGFVGEFISSVILSGSGISLTNAGFTDLTSISLTAGDWDVFGNVYFAPSSGATALAVWTNTISATAPDASLQSIITVNSMNLGNTGFPVPTLRYSLSNTTTVYISVSATFPSGTCTVSGGIYARRIR